MLVNLGYDVLILGDYGLNVDKVYLKAGELQMFPLDQPSCINLSRLVQINGDIV